MSVMKQYWPLVLNKLKSLVSSSSYKTWFSGVEFVKITNHGRKIVLSASSRLNKEYIEKKFKNQLNEAIAKYYPNVIHIEFEVRKVEEIKAEMVQEEVLTQKTTPKITKEEKEDSESLESIKSFLPKRNINNLNPKYSLENFVVNSANELAVSVSKSIIRDPGKTYNPVFIYSKTGMGKTHLLQAIGQKMLEERPGFKIKYTTLETFFNHFIVSVEKNNGASFREYYRSVDLLLIDDIQFITGKVATQQAFFHTFNELHQQNKQIVIASDRPPKLMDGIEDRLISRFEWGMVVDISEPDLEDRIAILKYKLKEMGITLSTEHVVEICKRVDTNIRDLEGVMNRIQARLKLIPDRDLSDKDLEKILSGYKVGGAIKIDIVENAVNSDKIMNTVSKVFDISRDELVGSSRIKNIALARQVAMWLCKNELDMSFPTVGKIFGGRDHTTVMYACQKIQSSQNSEKLAKKIDLVKKVLQS